MSRRNVLICLTVAILAIVVTGGGILAKGTLDRVTTPHRVTYYGCYLDGEIVSASRYGPRPCKRNATPVIWQEKMSRFQSFSSRAVWFVRGHLSIPGVVAIMGVATLVWFAAGRSLRGMTAVGWYAVPVLLFIAAACVAGPGHWFPKQPYEGPTIITLARKDAITALDIVGFVIAGAASVLAGWLLLARLQRNRRGRFHVLTHRSQV